MTLTGLINIEDNGNVEYPLFKLSALPNDGEVNFPASLSNIASVTYNNLD